MIGWRPEDFDGYGRDLMLRLRCIDGNAVCLFHDKLAAEGWAIRPFGVNGSRTAPGTSIDGNSNFSCGMNADPSRLALRAGWLLQTPPEGGV